MGTVNGSRIEVGQLSPRLPPSMTEAVSERYRRGETVVMVERDGLVVGAIAVATPLRPEAKPAIEHLLRWAFLGHPQWRQRTGGEHGGGCVGRLRRQERPGPGRQSGGIGGHGSPLRPVVMVGDGVNDAAGTGRRPCRMRHRQRLGGGAVQQ